MEPSLNQVMKFDVLLSELGVRVSLLDDTTEEVPTSPGLMFEKLHDIPVSGIPSRD